MNGIQYEKTLPPSGISLRLNSMAAFCHKPEGDEGKESLNSGNL